MYSSPIPCAVIGTDGYAYQLITRIASVPHALKLVSAVSLNLKGEGAQIVQNQGGVLVEAIPALFGHLPGNAVIFNPTPIPMHFETTRLCLENGFPVALEKPPVPTLEELDQLIALSRWRRIPVSVGFNYLYSNVARKTRSMLRSGSIGTVKRMRSVAAWRRPVSYYTASGSRGRVEKNGKPLFDGALGNPLSHVLAMLLSLASDSDGEMAIPQTVEAELYRGRDYVSSDDTASVRVVTTGGIEILINLTVAASEEMEPQIEIDGDCGHALIDNFEHVEIYPCETSPVILTPLRESRLLMLEEIAAANREHRDPLITLQSCRPFTQTINLAYESVGHVSPIPMRYRKSGIFNGHQCDYIQDIEYRLQQAHQSGCLLSEIGCPWAQSTRKVSPDLSSASPHASSKRLSKTVSL